MSVDPTASVHVTGCKPHCSDEWLSAVGWREPCTRHLIRFAVQFAVVTRGLMVGIKGGGGQVCVQVFKLETR